MYLTPPYSFALKSFSNLSI